MFKNEPRPIAGNAKLIECDEVVCLGDELDDIGEDADDDDELPVSVEPFKFVQIFGVVAKRMAAAAARGFSGGNGGGA